MLNAQILLAEVDEYLDLSQEYRQQAEVFAQQLQALQQQNQINADQDDRLAQITTHLTKP